MLLGATALLTLVVTKTLGAADESAAAHSVMCELFRAAAGTYTPPAIAPTPRSIQEKVDAINMSVAPKAWQDLFSDDDNTNAFDKLKGADKTTAEKLGGQTKWEEWRAAKKKAKALNIATSSEGEYPKITSAVQMAAAQQEIRKLVAQSKQLFSTADGLQTFLTDPKQNKIQSELNKALYGGDGTTTKPTVGVSTGQPTNDASYCRTTNAAKSITGDFLCLCGDSNANNKECSQYYTPTRTNGNAAIDTDWGDLKASCGETELQEAKPEKITAAIAAWQAALTIKSNGGQVKAFLGKSNTGDGTDCDGSPTKTCIGYDEYFKKTGGKKLTTLPWLAALNEAAKHLTAAANKEQVLRATVTQMEAIEKTVEETYKRAANGQLVYVQTTKLQTKNTASQQATNPNVECGSITEKPKCMGKCEWKGEEKTGKCEVNTTKVAEQAKQPGKDGATETGETKTTDKCGQAKTLEECAAVKGDIPKDKKAVCGWIDGKCQDYSFLLSKQFALSVVSAAFVSLIRFYNFKDFFYFYRS
uniref:Variant surface glycoprotein 1972 n=1 Tax=Trypanosoma brucei TaxID=5691 RepID=M4SXV6_9TRYP|nr:variant surface glycoprotein 1972 [Trypanosoma brucei]